jgi:hypothetical protein
MSIRLQMVVQRLEALGEISVALASHRLEILGVQTERLDTSGYTVSFEVRQRPGASLVNAIEDIGRIAGVEVAGSELQE